MRKSRWITHFETHNQTTSGAHSGRDNCLLSEFDLRHSTIRGKRVISTKGMTRALQCTGQFSVTHP